jgi:hypothetical protein
MQINKFSLKLALPSRYNPHKLIFFWGADGIIGTVGRIGTIRDDSCLINANFYQFVLTADSAVVNFLFQKIIASDFRLKYGVL